MFKTTLKKKKEREKRMKSMRDNGIPIVKCTKLRDIYEEPFKKIGIYINTLPMWMEEQFNRVVIEKGE